MTSQQLYDPDFDQPPVKGTNWGGQPPLEQLSPKMVFIGGIVAGVLALCTIGFFILLSIII